MAYSSAKYVKLGLFLRGVTMSTDMMSKVSESLLRMTRATGERPGHIRLCPDCFNKATEWARDYNHSELDIVLTTAFGAKVMPSAFGILCFNCGNGERMTEEYLYWKAKNKVEGQHG